MLKWLHLLDVQWYTLHACGRLAVAGYAGDSQPLAVLKVLCFTIYQ
ncbi:hypothetical protein [Kibdelosporangium aridum]|nr:hypothetical protein [Kibdelosporangium aridum]